MATCPTDKAIGSTRSLRKRFTQKHNTASRSRDKMLRVGANETGMKNRWDSGCVEQPQWRSRGLVGYRWGWGSVSERVLSRCLDIKVAEAGTGWPLGGKKCRTTECLLATTILRASTRQPKCAVENENGGCLNNSGSAQLPSLRRIRSIRLRSFSFSSAVGGASLTRSPESSA